MSQVPLGLKPPKGWLYDVRAGRGLEGLTTQLQTYLYLRSHFILVYIGNMVKTKEIKFLSFPGKSDDLFGKILYHQLPDMMIYAHAKFAHLGFMNKKYWEMQVFAQTEHPL